VRGRSVPSVPADARTEAGRLAELEVVIARGLQSYFNVGMALYRIREERLYREQRPGTTFEKYCWERWGFARQTAYDLIKAYRVVENVRTSVQSQPLQSQAVELASLEPAHQREVAKAIQAEGSCFSEIPVRNIRQIVREVKSGTSPAEAVNQCHAKPWTPPKITEDADMVPDPPEDAITQTGDLWILGEHRLIVGDATDPADMETLMAGDAADLVVTDPPYNVDYQGHTADRLKIKNDRMSDVAYMQFLEATFRSCRSAVKLSASLYVFHPSSWQREFQNALEAAGLVIRNQIIWGKNTFTLGRGRYKFQHEPIFYCHVAGQKDTWYGDKSQSTLWQANKPSANRQHPTMKPVELVERALVNSSKSGDIVLDLFGGSGSTLIACEQRGRKARLMEIHPNYANCIVRRFQQCSGKNAVLEGDGRTFAQIAEDRRREAA